MIRCTFIHLKKKHVLIAHCNECTLYTRALSFIQLLILTELVKCINSDEVALGINHFWFINRFTCHSQCHIKLWETDKLKQCSKCLSNDEVIILDPCNNKTKKKQKTKQNKNKSPRNGKIVDKNRSSVCIVHEIIASCMSQRLINVLVWPRDTAKPNYIYIICFNEWIEVE